MTSSPPVKMDLPDLPADTGYVKDDLVSPPSEDTGFASDGTYDSPTSETGKDLGEMTEEMKESSISNEEDEKVEGTAEEDKAEDDGQVEGKSSKPEWDGVMDILGNGLLKKKVLVAGKGIDSRPINGDTVTLSICGKLDDGTVVEDGEISFILNDGDVIVALDLGVALMELGEKCEVVTSPRYAYGQLGREPDIPKDASITFTLELTDIKAQTPTANLTFQERLQQGESKRLRGNFLFGRGDFSGAINSYTKAVNVLDDTDLNAGVDESDRAQLEDAWTKCYNNMAACQLKIDALDAAIRSAEKVLASQPKNIKALYRLGKAYGAKGEVDKAMASLKQAIQLDPESKMLHQEMFALTKKKNKETESERDLYRKMLGVKPGNKSMTAKKEQKNSNSIMRVGVMAGCLAAVAASVGFAWYRNS